MSILLKSLVQRLADRPAKLIFVSSDTTADTVRTFDDLRLDIIRLAAYLRGIGVESGQRVGILAPNCYAWIAWDLAAIELGCVSVAFSQERSGESVESLIQRYSLTVMAVEPAWVTCDDLKAGAVIPIDIAALPDSKRARARAALKDPAATHSLVFSSGTTGRTKGLIISRPGTEHLINLYGEAFGVNAGDRFLTFLPFANYQQRMTYYFCLHHGIDFVCVPTQKLFAALTAYAPTFMIAPPMFYESVHALSQSAHGRAIHAAAAAPDAPLSPAAAILGGRIRYLITGMAPIRRRTLEFFWSGGLPLFEAFGITEAGMVTWNKPGCVRVGTVGRPAESGSVSLTAAGEVIITRDARLSLGYFEASEEDQASTFISDVSVATGDIAQFDQDGFLCIVGRIKDAIITRSGEKFHPEPIESLIQGHGHVKVAVVMQNDTIPGTLAVVLPRDPADLEMTAQIRRHVELINEQLPVCQQVKTMVFTKDDFTIENGLRTGNFKLNRRAIRQAYLAERGAAILAAADVAAA
jgi:long-chain acyl-CoA synthetase